jgi:hypothetical protein
VLEQQVPSEVEVPLRNHLPQHVAQLVCGEICVHALVLIRDDDVDAVGVIADVLVDPVQLYLELLGTEADGTQDAEATRFGHGHHDVATVGEGEDREFDAELVTDWGAHGQFPDCWIIEWFKLDSITGSSLNAKIQDRASASSQIEDADSPVLERS